MNNYTLGTLRRDEFAGEVSYRQPQLGAKADYRFLLFISAVGGGGAGATGSTCQ